MFGDYTIMNLLQMLLHLVRTGEFFLTNRAGKYFSVSAFMIQEGVSLEAVFVLEALDNLDFLTLDTPVGAITGNVGILEQI